jgi:hypothetical protein
MSEINIDNSLSEDHRKEKEEEADQVRIGKNTGRVKNRNTYLSEQEST